MEQRTRRILGRLESWPGYVTAAGLLHFDSDLDSDVSILISNPTTWEPRRKRKGIGAVSAWFMCFSRIRRVDVENFKLGELDSVCAE
jgi:hypothetical protein